MPAVAEVSKAACTCIITEVVDCLCRDGMQVCVITIRLNHSKCSHKLYFCYTAKSCKNSF